jgi:hypothetical protein
VANERFVLREKYYLLVVDKPGCKTAPTYVFCRMRVHLASMFYFKI